MRSVIAERIGVDRSALYHWLKKHPDMAAEIENEIDHIIDIAETKLMKLLEEGEWKAIEKILNGPAARRRTAWKPPKQEILQETKEHASFAEAYKQVMEEKQA